METITQLQNDGFIGVDASLEISLFEYGFILLKNEHCTNDNEYFFVARNFAHDDEKKDLYSSGYIIEEDLDNIVKGKEWADKKDNASFLSFVGLNKKEWFKLNIASKVADLLGYWGRENIFGTDYWPWDYKGLKTCLKRHNIKL
jgi:hypothetical protein